MAGNNNMANVMFPAEVYGDRNTTRDSEIIGGSVVLIVLPTIFVTLRLISRWMARASLWWDDYVVVLGLVLSWGPNILLLIGSQHGFGRHIYSLPVSAITDFFKYLYAFELLYTFAMASVKISIILFQYRIFPIFQYRRILKLCAIFVACLTISSTLVCIFQCWPISGFWMTFAGAFPGAKCINVTNFILIAGSINAATDFILLAMPIPLLWNLRTSTLQKLILTGIFTVGLVVCSVSIVRLVLLGRFDPADDITWNYVPPALWTSAEPSIGIISGCLPSLRPLFAKVVWGRAYRPKMLSRSSYGYGHSMGWQRSGGGGRGERVKGRAGLVRSDDSFKRLHDGGGGSGEHGMVVVEEPWRHKALVKGGGAGDDAESEGGFKTGVGDGRRREGPEWGGIRVRTTVTVTEKVDWLDDLY